MSLDVNERYGDPLIEEKTQGTEFRQQFLRWLLRGVYNFYEGGRRIIWCDAIQRDTAGFWKTVDYLEQFLDAVCEVDSENLGRIIVNQQLVDRQMFIACLDLFGKLHSII